MTNTNINDVRGRLVGVDDPTRDDHAATKGYVDAHGGGGSVSVTDGTHTVTGLTELDFTSGATVTDAGGGVAQVAVSGGGSLPSNVTWDEDALIVNDDAAQPVFRLKTLISAGKQMTVRMAGFFTDALTTYNDNGDELFESDPLANGGDGEVRISGVPFSTATPDLAAVIAAGNTAGDAIAGVTDPTNAQDAATKASAQAQADAAEQNAKDYADSLSTGWQDGTGIHVLQGATAGVLTSGAAATFYRWAVDANGIVTVQFGVLMAEGTETTGTVVIGFPDLPLGSFPTFNRSGAIGCAIGGTEYNLFADISSIETEMTIVPAHVPAITDPLIANDLLAGMFSYPTA